MACRSSPYRAFLSASLLLALMSQAFPQSRPNDATAQLERANAVAAAIAEASRRFAVPETWIRAESNGDEAVVSPAGAIGLMPVMPETYAELRLALGIGPNPFAIRDNILAGTTYLRQMHDRYGIVGLAGPTTQGRDVGSSNSPASGDCRARLSVTSPSSRRRLESIKSMASIPRPRLTFIPHSSRRCSSLCLARKGRLGRWQIDSASSQSSTPIRCLCRSWAACSRAARMRMDRHPATNKLIGHRPSRQLRAMIKK